jgi:predicted ABC-type ATPase
MAPPELVMLAGPNGAGKSTFYESHLSDSPLPFLNADVLSAETGVDAFEAARFLDRVRDDAVANSRSFITETVFSDPMGEKVELLRRAMAAGFTVTLLYVGIEAGLSGPRIDHRVARGGHDVPRDRLDGRYERSLANLRAAIPVVSVARLYDNSLDTDPHRLIAVFETGKRTYLAPGPLPDWVRAVLPPEPPPRRKRTKKPVG